MRKRLVLLALLLGVAVYQSPEAQATCAITSSYSAFAHETITVSSTSVGFNSVLYDQASGQASAALVSVAGDAIRFFSDGTIAPTATVGHLVPVGSNVEVCGFSNVKNWRMIRQTTDATVTVSYFR